MHLARRLSRPLDKDPSPRDVLGAEHPLVRTLEELDVLRTQTVVVAALMGASAVALLDGVSGVLAIVIAAAVVQAILAGRAAILTDRCREHALGVIIEGRGDIPIAAVKRQRMRLLEPRCRQRLAASLDKICREAQHPAAPSARLQPLFNVRVVTIAAPDLAIAARLLRADNAGLRGIAMTQRLIADGTSPLYRDNPELLRQELRRIHYNLVDRALTL